MQKAKDLGLTFADRVILRASAGRRVDGLWVGTIEGKAEPILRRVEDALGLIKVYDRRRYDRIISDLERVWVRLLPGCIARYRHSIRTCELDTRFVLADTSLPEVIAATIVHEATHARLQRCGVGYEENLRRRVEAVCVRRELAFASKLPDGQQVRERAEHALGYPPGAWTNEGFDERELEGQIQTLRHLGFPNWLVRIMLAIRAWRTSTTASRTTR